MAAVAATDVTAPSHHHICRSENQKSRLSNFTTEKFTFWILYACSLLAPAAALLYGHKPLTHSFTCTLTWFLSIFFSTIFFPLFSFATWRLYHVEPQPAMAYRVELWKKDEKCCERGLKREAASEQKSSFQWSLPKGTKVSMMKKKESKNIKLTASNKSWNFTFHEHHRQQHTIVECGDDGAGKRSDEARRAGAVVIGEAATTTSTIHKILLFLEVDLLKRIFEFSSRMRNFLKFPSLFSLSLSSFLSFYCHSGCMRLRRERILYVRDNKATTKRIWIMLPL